MPYGHDGVPTEGVTSTGFIKWNRIVIRFARDRIWVKGFTHIRCLTICEAVLLEAISVMSGHQRDRTLGFHDAVFFEIQQ
jgi:hypothetical protein